MQDLKSYLSKIDTLPLNEQREILRLLEELNSAEKRELAREDFIGFVKEMWPGFIKRSTSTNWNSS